MCKSFKRVNACKAFGLHNILGHTLKAWQMPFNLSLLQSLFPTYFKKTTIISFEQIVKIHIIVSLPTTLDQLQFAYRPNRSTDDVIAFALHTAISHLDQKNIHV